MNTRNIRITYVRIKNAKINNEYVFSLTKNKYIFLQNEVKQEQ